MRAHAKYSVEYSTQAVRQLKKLDKHTRTLILAWIEKNLVDTDNPRRHGKSLTAEYLGKWRYRIGDYRLITHIHESRILILILKIGHRKDIY